MKTPQPAQSGSTASDLFGTWQPIATAPKDFTPILLVWHWDADGSGRNTGTSVILERWACRTHSHCALRHKCPDEPDCKMGWGNYAGKFTHWMPLPDVPNVSDQIREE